MSELALLRWIQRRTATRRSRSIVVDSGDDCAVVRIGGELALLKVDAVVEGVHFGPDMPWPRVGRKAMARPLSDIAAMGGIPVYAMVVLGLRNSMTMASARAVTRGLERWKVPIVGGDIQSYDGPCTVSVSVVGEMRGAQPVLRRGARPGDTLMVTGKLGASLRRHHWSFEPRLSLGRTFATTMRVNAMIDISDGLVRDLGHLGVGADLHADAIPCRGTLEQALYDGEDYELLVAAPEDVARRIERRKLASPIGVVSRRPGIRLHRPGGAIEKLTDRGFEHRFGKRP